MPCIREIFIINFKVRIYNN